MYSGYAIMKAAMVHLFSYFYPPYSERWLHIFDVINSQTVFSVTEALEHTSVLGGESLNISRNKPQDVTQQE